jgi:hypothetical protein
MMDLLRIKVGQILLVTYRQLIFLQFYQKLPIQFHNFMASITQRTSFSIVVPTSTNIGLSELLSIKVPMIETLIVMYLFSLQQVSTSYWHML